MSDKISVRATGGPVSYLAPLMVLREKYLDFDFEVITPSSPRKELKHLRLNGSLANAPTLFHDGSIVSGATAICEYIEDVFPDEGHTLRPSQAGCRAEMRFWARRAYDLWEWCGDYFPPRRVDQTAFDVQSLVHRLEDNLRRQEYVLATGYSLADIHLFAVSSIFEKMSDAFAPALQEPDLPGLAAWISRVRSRRAFVAMATDWCSH